MAAEARARSPKTFGLYALHSSINLKAGAEMGPITTIQDSTQWYAQGVGMVQTVNSGDAGSETIQLTSYSIP
jgi:hypothetical protein